MDQVANMMTKTQIILNTKYTNRQMAQNERENKHRTNHPVLKIKELADYIRILEKILQKYLTHQKSLTIFSKNNLNNLEEQKYETSDMEADDLQYQPVKRMPSRSKINIK